jgi:hypothetical protein
MQILRSFLALLAGFISMALLVGIVTAALTKFAPRWMGDSGHPRSTYVIVNLGYSIAAAIVGGYITAWLAVNNTLIHTLALALIVLLLGALSALQERGRQPIWYQLLVIAITPVGVLLGGLIHLKMLGI